MKIINQKGFLALELILVGLLLVAMGGLGYYVYQTSQGHIHTPASSPGNASTASGAGVPKSAQSAIQQFVTAMQNKDKATADSLESPAAKSASQQYYNTSSFYGACQQIGQFCTAIFSPGYLNKASKTYSPYTSSSGVVGQQVLYTLSQSLSGSSAGGQGCSSNSTSTLTIAAVPSGNGWLIDKIDPAVNASANLCNGQ